MHFCQTTRPITKFGTLTIRYTFEKGSPAIKITGNVNGNNFSSTWSSISKKI